MISERVALPVTIRTYYDTWVARLGYEGTFEGWICELIEQFHDLAGFELTVVVQVPSEVPGELHLQGANGSRQ